MSEKPKYLQVKKKSREDIWRESLFSGVDYVVDDVLKIIREEGNVKILPALLEFYSQNKDTALGKKAFQVISDIKDSNSVPVIIEAIDNQDFKNIRKDLLSLCWQMRLDFSPYLEKFVKIFLDGDIEEALEVFTAIENFEHPIAPELIDRQIALLKDNISEVDEFKKNLLVELVRILEEKKRLFS